MAREKDDKRVSEGTRKLLSKAGYSVAYARTEPKYYRKHATVNQYNNLLENQYVVRKYFQRKYGIPLRELELLLYLYPKGFFSHEDYKAYPLSFTHRQINSMIKKGYVQIFVEGENMGKHVYSLTKSAKFKVVNYYKLLSGELQIPVISENNPMIRKDATPHDKKIISMFKRLKAEQDKAKEED